MIYIYIINITGSLSHSQSVERDYVLRYVISDIIDKVTEREREILKFSENFWRYIGDI